MQAVKILLVEDDPKLASLTLKGLRARGFVVDHADNGDEGYTLATTRSYDALVLDIMLPGRDGLSILRQIRAQRLGVPVVLLTARSALNERLEGLNLGADDYLTKPFFVEELIARLHAVARRASGAGLSYPRKRQRHRQPRDPRGPGCGQRDRVDHPRIRAAFLPAALAGPDLHPRANLRARLELPFRPRHQLGRCLRPAPAQKTGRCGRSVDRNGAGVGYRARPAEGGATASA
jgi:CheY-like chemotaxis protein